MVSSVSALRVLVVANETAISSRNTFFEFRLPKQINFLCKKSNKNSDQSLKIRFELQVTWKNVCPQQTGINSGSRKIFDLFFNEVSHFSFKKFAEEIVKKPVHFKVSFDLIN